MSLRVRLYLAVLFFLFILTCATGYTAFIQEPGKVTCGSREMQPGDTCEHTRNGITTATNDYETEKRDQENGKYWSTIGVFPLALGTIGWLCFGVFAAKRVKRRPSSLSARANAYANSYPQAGSYPPRAGNYPSPNNYPPQAGNYPAQGGGYPPANQYPPQGYYPPPITSDKSSISYATRV